LAEPQRGWGLTARAASPEELAAFGAEHGVVATKVAIGQGAFLLGIRGGDLLMQVGATPLLTLEDLEAVLDETEPDDVISIAFRRIDEQGLGSFLAVGSRQ
jgi:S1-C subfamily serine protease